MNKLLSFTGGKPDFNIDDMLWNDEATMDALNDLFRAFGDNYIIYGVTGATSITAGYIMLDGEILKVDAHTRTSTHFAKVTTYDAGGDATFNNGTARQTWQKNRATISAGSGSLVYLDAKRLSNLDIDYSIKEINIGAWNMNTISDTISVAHGLSNYKNIRKISIIIRDDADLYYYDLTSSGSVSQITSTNITLYRTPAGVFANTDFDGGANRGWITIEYI